MATKRKEPWERPNPRPARKKKKLTAPQKKSAKDRARRAGRPYPNLVDNMRAASKKKTAKKTRSASSPRRKKKARKKRG